MQRVAPDVLIAPLLEFILYVFPLTAWKCPKGLCMIKSTMAQGKSCGKSPHKGA